MALTGYWFTKYPTNDLSGSVIYLKPPTSTLLKMGKGLLGSKSLFNNNAVDETI